MLGPNERSGAERCDPLSSRFGSHGEPTRLRPDALVAPSVAATFSAHPARLAVYVRALVADLTAAVAAMNEAYERSDAAALGGAAHTAKGLARALRDPTAGRLVESIDAAARRAALPEAQTSLQQLTSLLVAIRRSALG